MPLYLNDIPLSDAKKIIEQALIEAGLWKVLGHEIIPLNEQSVGRVLANSIHAKISSPNYNSSAMDGFAVRSFETNGAKPAYPLILKCGEKAKYVDTGDPIPDGFDSIIQIEDIEPLDEIGKNSSNPRSPYSIRIRASVVPWNNIRSLGEDIILTQLLYSRGYLLRPVDLSVIAAAGYSKIEVTRKPKVVIIPTGSELVQVGEIPRIGEILETNSLALAGKINEWGAESTRSKIIKDDFDSIYESVMKASEEFDLILLNAGSSAGSEDYSSRVIETAGKLLVHGIAVRPGHPVIIGMIKNSKRVIPIMGLPGYPVSAILTLDILVEKILAKWLGRPPFEAEILNAEITKKITSPSGDDDFVRVVVAKMEDKYLATPLPRGAGVISSLSKADGILLIPSGIQGLEANEIVNISLLKTKGEIDQTILFIGSHDLIIDELARFLAEKERRLISINVGSIGGLISLNREESHLAGSHLLDPETGEYNLSYISKYITNIPVKIISLAMREQGLLVKKNNPKKIKSFDDLTRNDVMFINRQRGAGTRILLDYNLSVKKILPEKINGYNQEEYTHFGIAAAVISGRADCGLGIAAASLAFDLDFVPLFNERYDLIINQNFADSDLLNPIYKVLDNPEFRKYISEMKGYNIETMGKVIEQNSPVK
jgi:putative molybdopterin biosynthesis protein